MKSATNHILVITGKPRTGKSNELIGLVEDATESASSHAAFLFVDKLDIQHLPQRCVLIQRKADQCPIQTFLDVAGEKTKSFTHVFVDDVSVAQAPAVLRFAESFPEINIAVVMN